MVKKYTLVTVETPSGWLLINRTNPPYRGMWNTLGGKFLPNETPATCASRELQEESHIIIPPHDLINGGRVFGMLMVSCGPNFLPSLATRKTSW